MSTSGSRLLNKLLPADTFRGEVSENIMCELTLLFQELLMMQLFVPRHCIGETGSHPLSFQVTGLRWKGGLEPRS